jgi:hypothetical protein
MKEQEILIAGIWILGICITILVPLLYKFFNNSKIRNKYKAHCISNLIDANLDDIKNECQRDFFQTFEIFKTIKTPEDEANYLATVVFLWPFCLIYFIYKIIYTNIENRYNRLK